MQLEINLLKVDSIYAINGQLIARNRSQVTDDPDVMKELVEFLGTNIDYINAAVSNKELVNKLSVVTTMTTDEFNALNYILAEDGLMITYYIISDVEVDADGVLTNSYEYNIIDKTNYLSSFTPYCTKIVVDKDSYSTSAIYEKIVNMYGLFKDELFSGIDPIDSDIRVMKEAEQLVGAAPEAVIGHTISILEFLGKSVRIITN